MTGLGRRATRLLGTFGAASILVFCTLLLAWTDQLWRLDQIAYDGFLRSWSRQPAAAVTIVAIDERSLREIGPWPWSRRVHAELIDDLTLAGAAVIGLDVAFAEPAADDPAGDAALTRAIEMSGRVVLPVIPSRLDPAGQVIELLPMPDLPTAAASLGHTEVVADADGVVRRHHLEAGLGVPYWPSLALAMLQVARGKRASSWISASGMPDDAPDTPYAWIRGEEVLVPYVGPPGTFRRLSAAAVLSDTAPPAQLRGTSWSWSG